MREGDRDGKRFSGIIPPLVTPLSGEEQLDRAGVKRLIAHLVGGGVHGVLALGTTGEAPGLSHLLRARFIDAVVEEVAGRVPVIVGVSDTSVAESLELACHAKVAGADAVLLAPPYYLPPGQPELRDYILLMADRLPLPCLLYNMPPLTKVEIGVEVLASVVDHENLLGLKDSSGDLDYFAACLEVAGARPDWSLFVGPEQKLPESIALGGNGGVPGGANLFPRFFVRLFEAVGGDEASESMDVLEAIDALYRIGHHASSVIKGIKGGLAALGVCEAGLALPFRSFAPPEVREVETCLARLREMPELAADFEALAASGG